MNKYIKYKDNKINIFVRRRRKKYRNYKEDWQNHLFRYNVPAIKFS